VTCKGQARRIVAGDAGLGEVLKDWRILQPNNELQLDGQICVVTGGTVGIGRAACLLLAKQGACLVIVGRNRDRLEATALEVERQGHGRPVTFCGDVRREQDMENMAATAVQRCGGIDVLIASAGILRARGSSLKTLAQMSLSEWNEVVDTNLRGVFLSNRAVLPTMIRQRRGQIINLSSTSGRKGYAFDTAYCASKFGVIALTEALAQEVRPYGIRVQALLPGAIDTPMWDQNGPIRRPEFALPARRVAELVIHLLVTAPDTVVVSPVIEPFGKPARDGWLDRFPGPRRVSTATSPPPEAPAGTELQ